MQAEIPLITLVNGMTLPAAVIVLGNALERRGIVLSKSGDKLSVKGPNGTAPELTPEEIAGLQRYKWHLLALMDYQPPEPV